MLIAIKDIKTCKFYKNLVWLITFTLFKQYLKYAAQVIVYNYQFKVI